LHGEKQSPPHSQPADGEVEGTFGMNGSLRILAKVANRVIHPLGIQIVRVQLEYGSLDLYPEKERPDPPRYVNIGAGSFYHPYWHNLDTPNDFYASSQRGHLHIQHDLTSYQPLPFDDDTLKVVYMSHVIEHLSDKDVQYCLAEIHRCLQPGGFCRIACPDIDLEYDAYCRGDLTLWMWPTPWGERSFSVEQRFLEHFATVLTLNYPDTSCHKFTDEEVRAVFSKLPKEEALNFFINQIPSRQEHPENHVNWFNAGKIRAVLGEAGFENVYESRYGQSKCPLLRNTQLFDSTVPDISLYVESQK
jgi:predicted SAM-dependent methyltransferase